jgi:Tol biopolymer transport system component
MRIGRILLSVAGVVVVVLVVALLGGLVYAVSGAQQASVLAGLRWTDETPAWSPNGREIVFASNRGQRGSGIDHLYLMRSDGAHLRRLTYDRRDAREPSFSPDGKQIVFAAHVLDASNDYTEKGAIDLISADGEHRRPLTSGLRGDAKNPTWSPDGRWIAFIDAVDTDDGNDDSRADLYVVRPDGTGLHRLAVDVDDWSQPFAWAPDSREIAVVGADERIYRIPVEAARPVRVKEDGWGRGVTTDIDWSPDGRQIAYVRGRVQANTCFCDADGAEIVGRRLWILDLGTHRRHPVRALVGSGSIGDFEVTMTWLRGRRPLLAIFTWDGTVLITPHGRKVGTIETTNGGVLTTGSASSNGRRLLFVDGPDNSYRSAIFVADVPRGRARPLTQRSRADG